MSTFEQEVKGMTQEQPVGPPDMFTIPSAPGGIWKEKGLYLRWLSADARSLRLKIMQGHGFPGYKLFGGAGREKTMEIIEQLGLNETYYNSTIDRISIGEGPYALLLGYLTIEERAKRVADRRDRYNERLESLEDAYQDKMDRAGVRARRYENADEAEEERNWRRKGKNDNRVGYTGRRGRS